MKRVLLLLCLLFLLLSTPAWAALTPTVLTSAADSADLNSYATASVTPAANRRVYVFVASRIATGVSAGPQLPSLSGNGITWTQVSTQVGNGATPNRRGTWLEGISASPSAGAITITFNAETQTQATWSVVSMAADTVAITAQSKGANDGGTTGTTSTVTLTNPPGNTGNVTLAAVIVTSPVAMTVGAGYTQLSYNTESGDGTAQLVEWKNNSQTATASWGIANSWFTIAVDITELPRPNLLLLGVG